MRIEIINTKALQLLLALVGMLAFASAAAAPKDFELHQAVLDNNLQLVSKFLSKGANIDLIGSRKYGYGSALHLAVREGHLEIAQLLLERGAQVDVLDPDDFTPLHNAAWNGNLEMIRLLLDAGADIEASTYDGDTPLKLAQNNNQTRVAEFIQAKLETSPTSGAKVDAPTSSDPGVIDISGTYVADITGPITKLIKDRSLVNQILKIERSGDIFIGSFDDGRGKLYVEIEGDEFKFDWHAWSAGGKGTWTLKPGSKDLVGTWYKTGGTVGHTGKWNLTRIEDEADSVASADAPAIDISGTYTSIITYKSNHMPSIFTANINLHPKIEVSIKQENDRVTGTFTGSGSGTIEGYREGNTIYFDFYANTKGPGTGKWTIGDDASLIEGNFKSSGGYASSGTWNLTRVESDADQVPDISGTYTNTELTYPSLVPRHFHSYFFGDGSNLKVTIKQSGNTITGVISGENTGEFKGVIKGREITIESSMNSLHNTFISGKGTWLVSNDGDALTGSYRLDDTSFGNVLGNWNYGDVIGKWKFRKAESEMPRSLTGTYTSELTYPATVRSNDYRGYLGESGLEVVIEQKGDVVSGVFTQGGQGKFRGKGTFKGKIKGNEVSVELDVKPDNGGQRYGAATWIIGSDGNTLTGKWQLDSSTGVLRGLWDLTKSE